MRMRLLAMLTLSANLLLLVGCADDQARSQLALTNAKISQIQQNVDLLDNKVSNQKLLDILNRLDDLQNQIDQLNGSLDAIKQNQQVFQANQEQINQGVQTQIVAVGGKSVDIDAISPNNSSAPVVASAAVSQGSVIRNGVATTSVASDKQLAKAVLDLKAHKFTLAIKELRTIIKTSKNQAVVADANYYLAVAYAANGEYRSSIWVAHKFVQANPRNSNAPDALMTMYIAQTQLGMKKSAAKTADWIFKSYPNSSVAKKLSGK